MMYAAGFKEVTFRPMTRGEYNKYRGWEIPENENPNDDGYLVEYLDSPNKVHENHKGYISWSPKDVFDRAYKTSGNLTFGAALEAVKQGALVARKGWNGKGMFVFMRPSDELTTEFIPKVKSLPQSVKDYIDQYVDDKSNPGETGLTKVKFTAYLCMKAADGSIVNGWLASQTDMLAEDWCIL